MPRQINTRLGHPEKFEIDGHYITSRSGSRFLQRTWTHNGRLCRRSLGTEDFAQAKLILAEQMVAQATDLPPDRAEVQVILARYLEEKLRAENQPSADSARYSIQKHLIPFFGRARVADLTRPRLAEFERHMKAKTIKVKNRPPKRLSDGYVRRTQMVLAAALNWAHEQTILTQAPPKIKLRQVKNEKKNHGLSDADVVRLFRSVQTESQFRFLILMLQTGARPAAVLELVGDQCDMDNRVITLNQEDREQTNKVRPTIPMTMTLRHWLIEWQEAGLVMGQDYKKATSMMRLLSKQAGIRATPYSLRHTVGRVLRRYGVGNWDTSGMLGHRIAGTTERYAEFDPDYLRTPATVLDQWLVDLSTLEVDGTTGFDPGRSPVPDGLDGFLLAAAKGKLVSALAAIQPLLGSEHGIAARQGSDAIQALLDALEQAPENEVRLRVIEGGRH